METVGGKKFKVFALKGYSAHHLLNIAFIIKDPISIDKNELNVISLHAKSCNATKFTQHCDVMCSQID